MYFFKAVEVKVIDLARTLLGLGILFLWLGPRLGWLIIILILRSLEPASDEDYSSSRSNASECCPVVLK